MSYPPVLSESNAAVPTWQIGAAHHDPLPDMYGRLMSRTIFYLFLTADLVFIGVHGLHTAGLNYEGNVLFSDSRFGLSRDLGYSEVFEYIKLYWTAVGAGWLWWRTRQAVYGVGVVLFLFLVVDNGAALHERAGMWLIRMVDFGWGAEILGSDMGQMVYWVGIGGILLTAGGAAYRRATPTHRRHVQQVAAGMGGLVLFGVIVDAIHKAVEMSTDAVWADQVLTIVEDGGELVVISWIGAVVLAAVLDDAGTDTTDADAPADVRPRVRPSPEGT
jgi:hypothetical protein